MIVMDRPGFGASTRLAGRSISVVADDATELLDYLGLEEVCAIGGSGGGPTLWPSRLCTRTEFARPVWLSAPHLSTKTILPR